MGAWLNANGDIVSPGGALVAPDQAPFGLIVDSTGSALVQQGFVTSAEDFQVDRITLENGLSNILRSDDAEEVGIAILFGAMFAVLANTTSSDPRGDFENVVQAIISAFLTLIDRRLTLYDGPPEEPLSRPLDTLSDVCLVDQSSGRVGLIDLSVNPLNNGSTCDMFDPTTLRSSGHGIDLSSVNRGSGSIQIFLSVDNTEVDFFDEDHPWNFTTGFIDGSVENSAFNFSTVIVGSRGERFTREISGTLNDTNTAITSVVLYEKRENEPERTPPVASEIRVNVAGSIPVTTEGVGLLIYSITGQELCNMNPSIQYDNFVWPFEVTGFRCRTDDGIQIMMGSD